MGYIIRRLLFQGALALPLAFNAWGYSQDECLQCHGSGGSSRLIIDTGLNMSSVHAKEGISCVDCHAAITGDEHFITEGLGKVDCGSCHAEQTESSGSLSVLASFHVVSHPKQDAAMAADRSMCVSCHQGQAAHGEGGAVNNQNCYKCHSPLYKNSILSGYMHPRTNWKGTTTGVVSTLLSLAGLIAVILLIAGCFINPSGKSRDKK